MKARIKNKIVDILKVYKVKPLEISQTAKGIKITIKQADWKKLLFNDSRTLIRRVLFDKYFKYYFSIQK